MDAETLGRLRSFCAMVIGWNRSFSNLISRNDEVRIVARHVSESLQPAAWLKRAGAEAWLDFGSGAGFPAVPLAIVGVGSKWTLVESRRPKTLFIRKVIQELDLSGRVTVVHARLEGLAGVLPQHQGFTARATERLGPTLRVARNFVPPGGKAFLWKGTDWSAEADRDPTWREDWSFVEARQLSSGLSYVLLFERT